MGDLRLDWLWLIHIMRDTALAIPANLAPVRVGSCFVCRFNIVVTLTILSKHLIGVIIAYFTFSTWWMFQTYIHNRKPPKVIAHFVFGQRLQIPQYFVASLFKWLLSVLVSQLLKYAGNVTQHTIRFIMPFCHTGLDSQCKVNVWQVICIFTLSNLTWRFKYTTMHMYSHTHRHAYIV